MPASNTPTGARSSCHCAGACEAALGRSASRGLTVARGMGPGMNEKKNWKKRMAICAGINPTRNTRRGNTAGFLPAIQHRPRPDQRYRCKTDIAAAPAPGLLLLFGAGGPLAFPARQPWRRRFARHGALARICKWRISSKTMIVSAIMVVAM